MKREKVDVAILGAGPGGCSAAIRLSQVGKKVALIEADCVGGTCLNRGCIPTKAFLKHTSILREIHRASDCGIHISGFSVNWSELVAKKDSIVSGLRSNLERLIQSNGIELIYGRGTFVSPHEIEVHGQDDMVIQADHIIIATGSEPKQLPSIPFDHQLIYSSTSALNLQKLPTNMVIVGGGGNGCEFASLFSILGVKVSIIEMLPRILPLESEIISSAVSQAFSEAGIEIMCGEKVAKSKKIKDGIEISLSNGKIIQTEIAMVVAGRALNTDAIGLAATGVHTEKGVVVTDERMATNVDGIWAVGDITGQYLYAHVATHQGLVAADNILGKDKKMYYKAIPGAFFTYPEVGSVGYSLEKAGEQGFQAKTVTFPLQALGGAQATSHTEGFVRIIFEEATGRILGAQAIGYHASELIAELGLAITNELTIECIADTIHAHPTFSESWNEAAYIAQGEPLHFPRKLLSTVLKGGR